MNYQNSTEYLSSDELPGLVTYEAAKELRGDDWMLEHLDEDALKCEECLRALDHLDTIVNVTTGLTYQLFICHNQDCPDYGTIYNDRREFLTLGAY